MPQARHTWQKGLSRRAVANQAADSTSGRGKPRRCRSAEEVEWCLDAGYSSVMIDGSHRPYEENVALTAAMVTLAHRCGAWVEAELVGIAGGEGRRRTSRPGRRRWR